MRNELRGRTAIVGVGETDYSRASGRTELMLSLQAIQAALDDAGLKPSDVNGLMKWSVDTSLEADVAANLRKQTFPWPSLTSGFDPERTSETFDNL